MRYLLLAAICLVAVGCGPDNKVTAPKTEVVTPPDLEKGDKGATPKPPSGPLP